MKRQDEPTKGAAQKMATSNMNTCWRFVMVAIVGSYLATQCAAQPPAGDRRFEGNRDRGERRDRTGGRDENGRRDRRSNRDFNGNRNGGRPDRPASPSSGGSPQGPPPRSPAAANTSSSGDAAARVGTYAKGLLNRYDENKNGSLEKDEWSRMRSTHAAADVNRDGVITLPELTQHLRGFGSETKSNASKPASTSSTTAANGANQAKATDKKTVKKDDRASYRFLTAKERVTAQLPGTLKDWFLENDRNADGQIAMSEFSTSWSSDKVDEFRKLDPNNDGRITPQEYLRMKMPTPKK